MTAVAEFQAPEVRQPGDLLQAGIADLRAAAKIQQAKPFEALQSARPSPVMLLYSSDR